ncbi:MAG: DNA polymerase III subunit delta [Chloroflexi bacterium]|nr:DNA polymerase III subunit delta [Chloroflexota bacterium]
MSKNAPSFYIFHGDDDMAIEDELHKLRSAMRQTPNGDLNTVEFDGEQITAGEVIAAASAYPFLADKRLVIVKGMLTYLTRKGAGESAKKALDFLQSELPNLPPYARLVFGERVPLSENHKLLKLAAKHGLAKQFSAPKDSTGWILKRAKEVYGVPISPRAAAALASVTAEDLRRADNELLKLVSYVNGEREISETDVARLTPYVAEASLFDLVDALAEGRAADAAKLLRRLLDDREDPFAVYGMIVRQFRLLLLAKEHLTTGSTPSTIADALRVHRYVAEKLAKQTRVFSLAQLEKIYRRLLDYDVKMKTGRIEPELALDLLIASLGK